VAARAGLEVAVLLALLGRARARCPGGRRGGPRGERGARDVRQGPARPVRARGSEARRS
jgi:hypothetical protein